MQVFVREVEKQRPFHRVLVVESALAESGMVEGAALFFCTLRFASVRTPGPA